LKAGGWGATFSKHKKKGVLKMNKVAVAKTILTVMPLVDKFCESCRKVSYQRAYDSQFGFEDAERVCERIIRDVGRADEMHNLKVRVMDYLENMPKGAGALLRFYFIEELSTAQIANKINKSQRTVFRHIDRAINQMAEDLDKIGINYFTFKQLITTNVWVRNVFVRKVGEEK
jgi:DNA-directed RNA polymerase specialized sigma subunit